MTQRNVFLDRRLLAAIVLTTPVATAGAQAIVAPWGNVAGVRLDRQVFAEIEEALGRGEATFTISPFW